MKETMEDLFVLTTATGNQVRVTHSQEDLSVSFFHLTGNSLVTDIAWSLARLPRYAGNTVSDWSVAQHCLAMYEVAAPELSLAVLLHDAHEMMSGDIPTWMKHNFAPTITRFEEAFDAAVRQFLKIQTPEEAVSQRVSALDKKILAAEITVACHPSFVWEQPTGDCLGAVKLLSVITRAEVVGLFVARVNACLLTHRRAVG